MASEKELQLDDSEEAPKGKSKLILIIIIAVVVIGVGVGAALFLMGGDDESAEGEGAEEAAAEEAAPSVDSKAPAMYIKMKPEFIVNYQVGPRQRYLQIYMEAMTRSPQVADALEMHSPMIRSNIIRIMSEQEFEFLRTPDGRTQLREIITEEVRRIIEQETGIEGAVEEILFTNFVMQ